MSTDPTAVVLAAVLCGLGGALVPPLVRRLPEPPGDAGPAKEPYAVVAARPGLGWRAATASAAAGGLLAWAVGLDWPLLFLVPLVPVSVALAVVDWRTHLLPTVVVWPSLAGVAVLAGVCAALEGSPPALGRAAVGSAAAFGLFYLLWWVHSAGMGFGDVRLAALLGFALGYLGWAELVVGVYAGFLLFSVPGLLLAVVRRDRGVLRRPYPFGPFLVFGALLGVLLGPHLWAGLASG